MNCLMCSVPLKMTDCEGVEIHCCPNCQGVWIEGAGLDKIIERSAPYDSDYQEDSEDRKYEQKDPVDCEGHVRKSFLARLFD